jgi:hypothetical protein
MEKKSPSRRNEKLTLHRETLRALELGEIRRVVGGLPQSDFCTQYRKGISTCTE